MTAVCAVTDWDWLADLEVEIEDYALERLERDVSSDFTRVSTVIRLRGGGEEGVGEDVVYDAEDHDAAAGAGPVPPLAGRGRSATFSEHLRTGVDLFPQPPLSEASAACTATTRTSRRRWTSRCARPARRCTPTSAREPRPLTYVVLAAPRRAADARPGAPAPGSSATPACASSSTRPAVDREIVEGWPTSSAVDSVDFKGLYTARSSTPRRPRPLPPRARRAARGVDRGPAPRREVTCSSCPPRPHLVGREHPRHRRHRGAAVPAEDGQRQAVAGRLAAPSCSRPTRTASSAASRCTAAGSSSSGPAAGRSSCSPSLFHPDGPNDVSPSGFHVPDPPRICPARPWTLPPPRSAFAAPATDWSVNRHAPAGARPVSIPR